MTNNINQKEFLNNAGILITGGTGSFGKAFLAELLNRYPKIPRIVIYSRDELKQWEMQQIYPKDKYPQVRFFLGDIRDKDRFYMALHKIDIVVHAAALKQVPAAEFNPFEFIKTNVLGAQNVIEACLNQKIRKVVALSTDKAAAPINLYGATKLCSDKLFIAANNLKKIKEAAFSVVRYGNVLGSRGSVVPFFIQKAKSGFIPITNKNMTRFNITLSEGVNMVLWTLENSMGGEIFVPKIPSYKIIDVAEAIAPSCKKEVLGIRPGEKIHEEMITAADSFNTYDLDKYFIIVSHSSNVLEKLKKNQIRYHNVPDNFAYNSGSNPYFLNIEEIRQLIKQNLDPKFKPF